LAYPDFEITFNNYVVARGSKDTTSFSYLIARNSNTSITVSDVNNMSDTITSIICRITLFTKSFL